MKILWAINSSMMLEGMVTALDGIVDRSEVFIYPYEEGFEDLILEKCEQVNPDITFFVGSAAGPYFAEPKKLKRIKEKFKLVHVCTDGGCPGWYEGLKAYEEAGCFDLTVSVDGCRNEYADLVTLTLVDPKLYELKRLPFKDKSYNLGFMGGGMFDLGSERESICSELETEGLLTINRQRDERFGSYERYVDFIVQCRSVLNFSRTGSGKTHHVKNRVIEAGLSQACLFEPLDSPAHDWFDGGMYAWETPKDIIKILDSEPHRLMADAGLSLYEQIIEHHSPKAWFNKVQNKLK